MMKKQTIIVGITLVFIIVGLTGCFEDDSGNGDNNEADDSRFVGEWLDEDSGELLLFKSNGSYYVKNSYLSEPIYISPWEVKGDELCFILSSGESCLSFEFSNDYKTLSIYFLDQTNPPMELTKQ